LRDRGDGRGLVVTMTSKNWRYERDEGEICEFVTLPKLDEESEKKETRDRGRSRMNLDPLKNSINDRDYIKYDPRPCM